mgnify:FL=1
MAVLRRRLSETTKGCNQDWWDLCYDDARRLFFVEYRWHHLNETNGIETPYRGREHVHVGSLNGSGWWLIDDFEDELLSEAGHD